MLKLLSAVIAAAIVAGALTLPPAHTGARAQPAGPVAKAAVLDPGCERAFPYPRCSPGGRLPLRSVRLITTDRIPGLRPIEQARANLR